MYKLNSSHPLLWRTPTSVQLGFQKPLCVLENVSTGTELFLAALQVGFSHKQLPILAKECSMTLSEAHGLLMKLAPACSPPSRPVRKSICIDGTGYLAATLGQLLQAEGHQVSFATARNDVPCSLAIIISDYVVEPSRAGDWLRREIPHLLITSWEQYVEIGPCIDSSDVSPCLHCLQLWVCEEDSSWPALATQISGSPSPVVTPLVCTEVSGLVGRWIRKSQDGRISATTGLRIEGNTGKQQALTYRVHPECSCRALPKNAILLAS